MKKSALKILVIAVICAFAFTLEMYAQNTNDGGKNFPFSQNPKKKTKPVTTQANPIEIVSTAQANNNGSNGNNGQIAAGDGGFEGRSSAEKLAAVSRSRNAAVRNAAKPATELYRVGAGDMLDIRLLNAESRDSTLFTVADDGSIDYPLAGGTIQVGGMTNDEIEEMLADKVKLYENPDLAVTIRNYASHMVSVSGQVDKPGSKVIRKDAVYLNEVLKEAGQKEGANKALISRADGQKITVDLQGNAVEETLVYPKDDIKLISDPKFYYISGVQSVGEKAHRSGITLTQAILACGGLQRESANKVFIRRKSDKGLLISTAYSLKEIKEGKTPDPEILAGDTIEIDK
jgi:protein involved in polysaccharide export with SLBB domain